MNFFLLDMNEEIVIYISVAVFCAFTVSRHYSEMGREVSELEWAMEIEGPPNYQGYRLDPDLREKLTKVKQDYNFCINFLYL